MTDAPTKRPWFQFHLSTAVVVNLVAGCLMYLNMVSCSVHRGHMVREPRWVAYDYGWPLAGYSVEHVWSEGGQEHYYSVVAYGPQAADVGVALAILLGISILLEWLIRRRERRP